MDYCSKNCAIFTSLWHSAWSSIINIKSNLERSADPNRELCSKLSVSLYIPPTGFVTATTVALALSLQTIPALGGCVKSFALDGRVSTSLHANGDSNWFDAIGWLVWQGTNLDVRFIDPRADTGGTAAFRCGFGGRRGGEWSTIHGSVWKEMKWILNAKSLGWTIEVWRQPDTQSAEPNTLPFRNMCIEDSGGASEVPMAIRWSNSPSAHRHGSMPFLLVILRGELDGSQKKPVQAVSVNPTILLVRLTWENFGVAGLKWGTLIGVERVPST